MFRLVICSLLLCTACGPSADCGDLRIHDPIDNVCVCRPEYTQVGDECLPNDELDAAIDASVHTDAPDDSGATLTVVATNPENDAIGIEPSTQITVTFNLEVDQATLQDAISLSRADGSTIPLEIDWDGASLTASILPTARLSLFQEHRLTVTTAVTTPTGSPLAEEEMLAFATRDGVWGDPFLVESRTDNARGGSPAADLNSAGDGIACWTQDDGSRHNGWCSLLVDGMWSDPELLEDGAEGASGPRVAIADDGTRFAVWTQDASVWARRYDGRRWLPREMLGLGGRPFISMSESGQPSVVWVSSDALLASHFTTEWAPTETLPTGGPTDVDVAFDAQGDAYAVWESAGTVQATRYTTSGGWTVPVELSSVEPLTGTYINVSAAWTSGTAASAYSRQLSGRDLEVYVSRFGATWLDAEEVDDGQDAGGVVVASASESHTAVWCRPGGEDAWWFSVYRAASGYSAPATAFTANCGQPYPPTLGADAAGNLLFVYYDSFSGRLDLEYARYTNDGWTAALLELDDSDPDSFWQGPGPYLDVHPNGHAIAMWTQSDGTRYNVWARVFE